MSHQRLDALNKAYYYGEYDLKEYRNLRSKVIDEETTPSVEQPPEQFANAKSPPTLKIKAQKESAPAPAEPDKVRRGPSALQFLWISIAVILFIYMYTATIE